MFDRFTVLVVNDDGAASPLLRPFLKAISQMKWCGELRIVVPKFEQSWVAQCVTRFRELTASDHDFDGHQGYVVDGTAADCSSLGIHNLFGNKPDLVLTGVNMGWNAGLPFFMSSGTVGAAAEAFLTKVPAIALSAVLPDEVFRAYSTHDQQALEPYQNTWTEISQIAAAACTKLIGSAFWNEADIVSINLPWGVSAQSPYAVTSLMEAHFEKLFMETTPQHFRHKLQGVFYESPRRYQLIEGPGASLARDIRVLEQGSISVTPISYRYQAHVSEKFIKQVES